VNGEGGAHAGSNQPHFVGGSSRYYEPSGRSWSRG